MASKTCVTLRLHGVASQGQSPTKKPASQDQEVPDRTHAVPALHANVGNSREEPRCGYLACRAVDQVKQVMHMPTVR